MLDPIKIPLKGQDPPACKSNDTPRAETSQKSNHLAFRAARCCDRKRAAPRLSLRPQEVPVLAPFLTSPSALVLKTLAKQDRAKPHAPFMGSDPLGMYVATQHIVTQQDAEIMAAISKPGPEKWEMLSELNG